MLNIETKTRLSTAEVMKRVSQYFKGTNKMKALEEAVDHAFYEGAGGTVELSVCEEKGVTTLSILSREWDQPVKAFIDDLPKKVKY